MPRGATQKREREYQKIERKFKKEGRYKGREEEVAARIVNKQRAESGEAKTSKHKPVHRSASRRKSRSHRSTSRRNARRNRS